MHFDLIFRIITLWVVGLKQYILIIIIGDLLVVNAA